MAQVLARLHAEKPIAPKASTSNSLIPLLQIKSELESQNPQNTEHSTEHDKHGRRISGVPIEHDPTCSARSLQIEHNLKRTKVEINYPNVVTEKPLPLPFHCASRNIACDVLETPHFNSAANQSSLLCLLCISCDLSLLTG